jgi:hypothetical protein
LLIFSIITAGATMHASPFGPPHSEIDTDHATAAFYRHVLATLVTAAPPFLIGGAYALNHYTGLNRHTKDLDLFVRRSDFDQVAQALRQAGYEVELTYPHWLGKIHANDHFVDLIFSSGNGLAEVDDAWFAHAAPAELLGVPAQICPPEETIWSKAFVMERERYDGADIVHLLQATSEHLDWSRLLARFGPHWRVLLSHLTLFGFVYPALRDRIPVWVMDQLIASLREETHTAPNPHCVCRGTLLSRQQYLSDIEERGLQDARIVPDGNMTQQETAIWTDAIPDRGPST